MADARSPIFRIFGSDESAAAWASVQRNASSAIGRINGLLPGLGAALTAAGMVAFTKQAFDSAEQLNVLSQRTGIAVEELSALRFAGEQTNVGIESLALGVKRLSTSAFEAASGNSAVSRTFEQLGVSAIDANKDVRPTRELLLDMAERFSKMQDGATKTALAVKVFGKTGDELIPFLNQGRDGISRLTIEAERLGLVMSKESAEAANKFNDNMKALQAVGQSLAFALVNQTAPALGRISAAMREALAESGVLKALLVGLGGVLIESAGLGMKEASEKARDLAVDLRDLARAQQQLNNAQLSPDARKREQDKIDAQIAAKQNELKQLRAEIETERKNAERGQGVQLDLEQREKDQRAADSFIATLKKEAETYGLSREQIIRYNAAKVSASLQSVDIAIRLRNEAAALAKKIAAQQQEKLLAEEAGKRADERRAGEIAAVKGIVDEANALEQEAGAWNKSNEQRRTATLLQALVKAGIGEETLAYRQLEERLNAAAGQLAYYNELKAAAAARESGLKSLAQEIEDIRFETATLRLNNDQRERALALRKLFAAGVGIDNPQGAALIDQFDEAQADRSAERRTLEIEAQKAALDQRTALIFLSLQTEEEAEITSYLNRTDALAQARAAGLINEQQYQIAREELDKRHQAALTRIEDDAIRKRFGIANVYRSLDLNSASFFFDQMGALMQTKSRTLFEIGKAGAIAGAIIDTYKAATGAYAALASIPFVGPALGAAAALAAITIGAARVSAIKSTTIGGSGAVGVFAADPGTGLPEFPTGSGFEAPPNPIGPTAAAQSRNVNITFVGNGRYTQEEIREALVPALQEAFDAGVTVTF